MDIPKGDLCWSTCADSLASAGSLLQFALVKIATFSSTTTPEPTIQQVPPKWVPLDASRLLVDVDPSVFAPRPEEVRSAGPSHAPARGLNIAENFFSSRGRSFEDVDASAAGLESRKLWPSALQRDEEPIVGQTPLRLLDEFYSASNHSDCRKKCTQGRKTHRFTVRNLNLFWRIHTGHDWGYIRDLFQNPVTRSSAPALELSILGLGAKIEVRIPSEEGGLSQSSLAVRVGSVAIADHVPTSAFRALLSMDQPNSGEHPREADDCAARLFVGRIRNSREPEDLVVKLHIAPLRLQIDQDTLGIVIQHLNFARPDNPDLQMPEMQVDVPFIQSCEVFPIAITLDYKPKHLDIASLTSGKISEIANVFELKEARMSLERVMLGGISGWSRLLSDLVAAWFPNISGQLGTVIKGLAPIQPMVNVGAGLADLVLLPIEQFNKERKVMRGLQKGALSFSRLAGIEVLDVGSNLALGTRALLGRAEEALAQRDTREVADSLRRIAKTIVAVPVDFREAVNAHGVVETILQVIPVTVLKSGGMIAGRLSDILLSLGASLN